MKCMHCNVGTLEDKVLKHCPDGHPNCLVAHYGLACAHCGAEFEMVPLGQRRRSTFEILGPDDPKQKPIGLRVKEKIGIGVANLDGVRQTNVVITQPVGNCDGSGLFAYDPDDEYGRGARLATKCPGCRSCS